MQPMHLAGALGLGGLAGLASSVCVIWLPQCIVNEDAQWRAHIKDEPWQALAPNGLRACAKQAIAAWPSTLGLMVLGACVATWLVLTQGATWSTGMWAVWLWTLLTAAVIDMKTQLLPDKLTQPLLWLGLLVQTTPTLATVGQENAVWGAVFGYLILWTMDQLYMRWRGISGVGQGDMKLLAAIGAWLGAQAVPNVLLVAALTSLLAQAALRLHKSQKMDAEFAFGPWIAVAAVGYWFLAVETHF
ncbi:MAG: prepilin peptidase [Limnohabitans sp.]